MLTSLARVVAVLGKGGVGKTTVAAGLARLAREVGPTVFVEFGDGASGQRALGPRPGVTHRVVTPDEAIARGARGLFGSALLARMALDNFAMRPLLKVAPAVREVAMLEAVRQIADEHPTARVIVDMPATGHGVAWLRTARQGREFLGAGPLFELCDRLTRDLVAPGRLSPVIVTLPERLVLGETLELARALSAEVGLPAAALVLNRVPQGLPPGALAALTALEATGWAEPRMRAIVDARLARASEVATALDLARGDRLPHWCVPLHPGDPGADAVAEALRPASAEAA
jgi:arsenite-transporting ATPase